MTDTIASLRLLLAERYDEFRNRLARRLDSPELAEEALQDTFVRLARTDADREVRNPNAYLFRMAFNTAISKIRSEQRRIGVAEGQAFLDLIDETPGPDRIAEGRADARHLERVLGEMPARRREIFIAAWVEEEALPSIAARYGLTLRMIQIELKRGVEYVSDRMKETAVIDFASAGRKES